MCIRKNFNLHEGGIDISRELDKGKLGLHTKFMSNGVYYGPHYMPWYVTLYIYLRYLPQSVCVEVYNYIDYDS